MLQHIITPNGVTLLSMLTGIAAGGAIAYAQPLIAFALLMISGWLDTLDGTLARLTGNTSPVGAMYDILADRVVECAVMLGLLFLAPEARGVWVALMFASVLLCVTSFLVAGIFLKNDGEKSFNYSPGLMERPEAFLIFILMLFLPAWFAELAIIFTGLVLYTAGIRLIEAVSIVRTTP